MITIVSNSGILSGNATRILNLAKHLDEVQVIFSAPRNEFKGVKIDFTRSSNKFFSMCEKSIKILLGKTDLMHCFKTLPTSGIPALLGKAKGVPLIVDWDDYEGFGGFADQDPFPYNYIVDYFEKFILKKADALTVVSSFLEEKARELGFQGDIYFIPNGADMGIKYSFPRHEGKIRLLFIGLLYKSSDLDFAIRAMKYVKDAELVVVGDGPRRSEFECLSRELKLDNIEFVGMKSRKEVTEYIRNADVGLMPFIDNIANRSRSPVKLGEYLAAGKPAVTNPVGIMKEVIKNGENGILTSDTPEDFAEGINKLKDTSLREKISRNARKTAEKYSWERIARKLEGVYEGFE